MSKFKRILILVFFGMVAAVILSSGVIDLGDAVRDVDLKEYAQMERGCIAPNYFADQEFKKYLKLKKNRNQTKVGFDHIADRPMKLPKGMKKAFKKRCAENLKEGDPPHWGFYLATVDDQRITAVEALEPNYLAPSVEECLGGLLVDKDYRVKRKQLKKFTLGICARPTSHLLEALRASYFKNKSRSYNEADRALLDSTVKKIVSFAYEIKQPELFSYARLHLAIDPEGRVKAAFVSRQRGVESQIMDDVFERIIGTTYEGVELSGDQTGVWVSVMLDFQSKRLNAVPIKKVKYIL